MPQTVNTVRIHRTITLAANDLCTVTYSGDSDGVIWMVNNGPGVVWVSFDPTKPATVGDVNNIALKIGIPITFTNLERGTVYTLNADTASTILTLNQMP